MKKSLLNLAGAALLAFALSNVAIANPISGEINFFGAATLNNTPGSATAINSFGSVYVVASASTGDYSGIASLTPATFTPFSFGVVGTLGALDINPLWTVTYNSVTYSFELTSITINAFVGSQRLLEGNGIASISGGNFDATNGHWSLSTSGINAKLTFTSATDVPDGGTTALLVGLALLGTGLISRRKAS